VYCFILNMQALPFSSTSLTIYQPTRRNNSEDMNFHFRIRFKTEEQ